MAKYDLEKQKRKILLQKRFVVFDKYCNWRMVSYLDLFVEDDK